MTTGTLSEEDSITLQLRPVVRLVVGLSIGVAVLLVGTVTLRTSPLLPPVELASLN